MRIYFKIPYLGAVYIEKSILYRNKHLFSINKWDTEYIIDLFGLEIIITPWSKLKNENGIIHKENAFNDHNLRHIKHFIRKRQSKPE
jgi:hypothetical protein